MVRNYFLSNTDGEEVCGDRDVGTGRTENI